MMRSKRERSQRRETAHTWSAQTKYAGLVRLWCATCKEEQVECDDNAHLAVYQVNIFFAKNPKMCYCYAMNSTKF
jgi:hypothetical protein